MVEVVGRGSRELKKYSMLKSKLLSKAEEPDKQAGLVVLTGHKPGCS
jgi:hypothetical protein